MTSLLDVELDARVTQGSCEVAKGLALAAILHGFPVVTRKGFCPIVLSCPTVLRLSATHRGHVAGGTSDHVVLLTTFG